MQDGQRLSASQRMASAAAGALMTSFIVTPFDVVKTRLQAQDAPGRRRPVPERLMVAKNAPSCMRTHLCTGSSQKMCAYCRRWFTVHGTPRLNGTLDGLYKLARYEGLRSLWSGLQPAVAISIPSTVLYFTAYDELKGVLQGWFGGSFLSSLAPTVAGVTARVGTVVAVSPLELLRTQMQAQRASLTGVTQSLRRQVAAEGWSSIYRGLEPTLLRDVPFSGIYWAGYELIKRTLTRMDERGGDAAHNDGQLTFSRAFLAGAGSGTVAAILTTPFDVIKTRMQAEVYITPVSRMRLTAQQPLVAESMTSVFRAIMAQQGVPGLFAGITARVAKVAPACAIMISSYEYAKFFFLRNQMQPL